MDEFAERAGLDQGQRRRPPRQRLERAGEADERPLLLGEPRPLRAPQILDQPQARLTGGDVGLGGFDARGDGVACGARLFGGAPGTRAAAIEPFGADPRLLGLALGGGGFCGAPASSPPAAAHAPAAAIAKRGERGGGDGPASPYPSR